MKSKRLFAISYLLLFASFGLSILVFSSPTSIFTLPKGVAPDIRLSTMDALPTLVFLAGVVLLLAAVLKQRAEKIDEEL